nr:hypothetical protein Iba_scaffold1536CG1440 [Ipomoea batatas]
MMLLRMNALTAPLNQMTLLSEPRLMRKEQLYQHLKHRFLLADFISFLHGGEKRISFNSGSLKQLFPVLSYSLYLTRDDISDVPSFEENFEPESSLEITGKSPLAGNGKKPFDELSLQWDELDSY